MTSPYSSADLPRTIRAASIPQPGEWERIQSRWPEHHHAEPKATMVAQTTNNPVTKTLLGPDGEVMSQWTDGPPVGFSVPERS